LLQKGEAIVSIPSTTFITHDSDFVRQAGLASKCTVYGTVAAALTLEHEKPDRWYAPWQATWPSPTELETIMPLCWSTSEQDWLPHSAKTILKRQQEKFDNDVNMTRSRLEHIEAWLELYKYYWLIVNTRCFFWDFFKKAANLRRRGKKLARDECLALVPWGDYFNHEDTGVSG
jgi:hypothetical protein